MEQRERLASLSVLSQNVVKALKKLHPENDARPMADEYLELQDAIHELGHFLDHNESDLAAQKRVKALRALDAALDHYFKSHPVTKDVVDIHDAWRQERNARTLMSLSQDDI